MLMELECDLLPFCKLNDRTLSNGEVSTSDREALMRMAPLIVKKHLNVFLPFFVTWLSELDSNLRLKADDGSYEYAFDDKLDASNAIEKAILQAQDEMLSGSVCILLILSFLTKRNMNVRITTEEAEAAIRTIARLAYSIKPKRGLDDQASLTPFADTDKAMLRRLAVVLGNRARKEGYAEFTRFAPEAESCAVGVLLKAQKFLLATFVVTRDPDGCNYSVRNFQNESLPGLPDMFQSITQAIVGHQEYFIRMAGIVRKMAAPWWKRPFI